MVVENIGRVTCICSDKTGTLTEGKLTLAHTLPVEGIGVAELRQVAALAARAGSGDPIDVASLGGVSHPAVTLQATFPFTEDRRRETSIVRLSDGGLLLAVKGAPETIFDISELSPKEKTAWLSRTEQLGATGHKVLACARKSLREWSGGEPDRGFELVGLLAFEDPVRDGVKEAVGKAQAAGIRVIMVTGDHVTTAAAMLGKGTPTRSGRDEARWEPCAR